MTPPENSLFASGRKELSMSKTSEYYRLQDEDEKMKQSIEQEKELTEMQKLFLLAALGARRNNARHRKI